MLEARRDKTRALKQGMMQELLTGRTRSYEDFHCPRSHRQRAHGAARVPARVRLESRPGAWTVRLALPPPSGGRPARLGHGIEDGDARGDGPLAAGIVKLLLDGQQRMTSLYGVVRGKPPKFFDGNAQAFTGLRFHLEGENFEFYQPLKMKDDPLWIDVTELMQQGTSGLGASVTRLSAQPHLGAKVGEYVARLSRLLGITDVDLHVEEVTGADKSLDVVVDIFNRVNSGGTKLSKGDLALAKIAPNGPRGATR